MAHISKLPSGRWQAQVWSPRCSKSFATKKEATLWAAGLEARSDGAKSGRYSFGDAVDKYIKEVCSKKTGAPWEKRRLEVMRSHFGDETLLAHIDAPQIAAWRDARLKTVSGSTVVRESNLLRNLFNLARREWRWCSHEPFSGVKLPKENPARHQVWTWPLIKRVLRAPRIGKTREMQLAFHIALRSGMRLGEVLAAPTHFDPLAKVVIIKTKTEARAVIPIGRIAAGLIGGAKFTVAANEGSVLFSKLCRELLITDLTFHDARATALTHLARKVDVLTLAKISRHKDLSLLSNVYYRETASAIAKRI